MQEPPRLVSGTLFDPNLLGPGALEGMLDFQKLNSVAQSCSFYQTPCLLFKENGSRTSLQRLIFF